MAIAKKAAHLVTGDLIMIGLYFVLVVLIGLFAMWRSNRSSVSGYFLAGRFITWFPIGASLFASNIGSEHFVGLAGSGSASGIGVGAFELNALIILQVMAWIFLPVYIASGVTTLPQYMHRRFGGTRIQLYLSCLSLALYLLTKISVNMYSGALFVQRSLGWNIYWGIFLILSITAICTITGGLTAVIYTDTLQCILMLVGSGAVAIKCMNRVGGYHGLVEKYMAATADEVRVGNVSTGCGVPSARSFTMLRPADDPDMPWFGFLVGQSPASIWYWAADQMIVQRALAAKSISHAQGGAVLAGYFKILPFFCIVLPGMASRVLNRNTLGCVTDCEERCGNPVSCSNFAYPLLVIDLLPDVARGAMLAVMLAALMSDLTSIFNSSSTLFSMDIWPRLRRRAGSREKLLVGRLFVLVMVGMSVAWIPILQAQAGGQLYIYIQSIAAYFAPPIAAVYLLAILWSRCNEKGAFWPLMISAAIGVVRMILDFVYAAPRCGDPDTRPAIVAQMHYMYFALLLFWLSIILGIAISLMTEPVPAYRLIRTTYWTRYDTSPREDDKDVEDEPQHRHFAIATASETGPSSQPIWRKIVGYICGLEETESDRQRTAEMNANLRKLTALDQTDRERWVLRFNVMLVLSVAVFLYVFFSVYSPVQYARELDEL